MDPMRDLPMGFGMALLQNEQATRAFYALSPAQQQEIIQRTHAISSKAEMRSLVDSLTNSN
ncbi:MAG: hypothetical protein AB7E30_12090, partial [Lawsonibacter sp.]